MSTHAIANQISILAAYDKAADFSPIKEAIERIERERTRRALKAIAELEAAKSEHRGRRFIITWQDREGALCTTRGIAYLEKHDEKVSPFEAPGGVLVDDLRTPFSSGYRSMQQFRDTLDRNRLSYVIVYLDE